MLNIFVLPDIRWNFPSNEMSGRSLLIRFREELFSFFGEIQFRLGSQDPVTRRLGPALTREGKDR